MFARSDAVKVIVSNITSVKIEERALEYLGKHDKFTELSKLSVKDFYFLRLKESHKAAAMTSLIQTASDDSSTVVAVADDAEETLKLQLSADGLSVFSVQQWQSLDIQSESIKQFQECAKKKVLLADSVILRDLNFDNFTQMIVFDLPPLSVYSDMLLNLGSVEKVITFFTRDNIKSANGLVSILKQNKKVQSNFY